MTEDKELLVWQDGPLGRLRLNRPRALNALTSSMAKAIEHALTKWRDDDSITAVVIDAEGDKAFCAGGDILDLYAVGKGGDPEPGRQFWQEEYRLNAMIDAYPKPYIAIMNGITLGGGVGISAHGSHRIVTERTMLAMPETGIGFMPDAGGTWILSRAPGLTGHYLGMAGARLNASDAIFSGFADYYVESKNLSEFIATLKSGDTPNAVVAKFALPVGDGQLKNKQTRIKDAFSQPTALGCVKRLQEMAKDGDEWAEKTYAILRRNAPLAVAATFEAINAAKKFSSLEQCLALEYRFAHRAAASHDFYEGIRAAIIDKDKKPQWEPNTLEDVTPTMVDEVLAPLGEHEWTAA
ncbi:MAG: enoyl-CoA hydratase/isomerase family protein [Hyphomicrobiaceae bacterium]